MPFIISDLCVCCGACRVACPTDAISMGDHQFVIDTDLCINCNGCYVECPTGAIG